MSRRRNQHRSRLNKSMERYAMSQTERRIVDLKSSEGFAPNEMITSSIARVHSLHKSEYAVHGEYGHRRKLAKVKAHNKTANCPTVGGIQRRLLFMSTLILDSSNGAN